MYSVLDLLNAIVQFVLCYVNLVSAKYGSTACALKLHLYTLIYFVFVLLNLTGSSHGVVRLQCEVFNRKSF